MPRRRGLDESTFFHVWNRGADRQDIFTSDGDQDYFEALLAETVDHSGARIHAYALMTNHYHLIVEAEGAQLSDAMYHLGRGYAIWYNRSAERTGPLCDGRFGSEPIVDDEMFLVECRYVHRNPADIVGLDALCNYRFSSLAVYAGRRRAPVWLTTNLLSGFFSGPNAHVEFVRRTHPSDTQFSGRRPPLRTVDLDSLEAVVASLTGVSAADLVVRQRGRRNDAGSMVLLLAVEMRLAPHSALAARYGYESERSVRNALSVARAAVARDPSFARFRDRVLAVVSALGDIDHAA